MNSITALVFVGIVFACVGQISAGDYAVGGVLAKDYGRNLGGPLAAVVYKRGDYAVGGVLAKDYGRNLGGPLAASDGDYGRGVGGPVAAKRGDYDIGGPVAKLFA